MRQGKRRGEETGETGESYWAGHTSRADGGAPLLTGSQAAAADEGGEHAGGGKRGAGLSAGVIEAIAIDGSL